MYLSPIAAAGVIVMSLAAGTAQGAEIVVFSTISCKEALIELVPEFERASGHKVNITYAGGSGLSKQIRGGTRGDLFIGPEEFSGPLIDEGKLLAGSRTAFARSSTGLAVRAGVPKPDISSPEKLKSALLAAGSVSYSAGASGMHFVKVLEQLGIADAIAAKRVAAASGRAGRRRGGEGRRRHRRAADQRAPAGLGHRDPRIRCRPSCSRRSSMGRRCFRSRRSGRWRRRSSNF